MYIRCIKADKMFLTFKTGDMHFVKKSAHFLESVEEFRRLRIPVKTATCSGAVGHVCDSSNAKGGYCNVGWPV